MEPLTTAPTERWRPEATVATVVARDGRLLLVEESKGGRLVLNQPAGHLEPDESLIEAAVRETLEETAWTVRPTALVGVYQWRAPDGHDFLRFVMAAEALSHDPARALDTGIVRALWMTPQALREAGTRLRSPLVWQAVADWMAGSRQPLSLLRRLP